MATAKLYSYYQIIGGSEAWKPIQADLNLDEIKPTFVTILKLDTLLEKNSSKELIEAAKYLGPMYFDLDDAEDVSFSIEDAKTLVRKLKDDGLTDDDIEVYLSGKKGLHVIIPPVCFMERQVTVSKLPAVYKEIAMRYAVDTLDFKVYTARTGRMLRTCYNIRENGNYRVPISIEELETLTAAAYQSLCKNPRPAPPKNPQLSLSFSLVYEAALQKIAGMKRKKLKPVSPDMLKHHLPTVKKLMAGDGVGDAGFNKIAIQLATYAREVGMTEDALVIACEGLLQGHSSDGNRYNTPRKRENELRRMFHYVDDNPSYEYSFEAIKSLTKHIKEVAVEEGEEVTEVFSSGVREGSRCYIAPKGETGDVVISNFIFAEPVKLVDPALGTIIGILVRIVGDSGVGKVPAFTIYPSNFIGSAALHSVVAPYGGGFSGTDIQARGVYQVMLKKVTETRYIVDSEGLNVISIPSAEDPALREPFVVWADGKGVRVPDWIEETGVRFEFQGFPEIEGVIQTDLTNAPNLSEWLREEGNPYILQKTLKAYFLCHTPEVTGKMLGWMTACFWRQLFNKVHEKFPLLHVYGIAGAGKSELVNSLLHLFYYSATPQSITPSSTPFAFLTLIGGSGCIPIPLDEYKPGTMGREALEKYRAIFRDAYNMKFTHRGGGNRVKDSFNVLNKVSLTGPIVFMGESVETETAIVERYVLVGIKRATPILAAASLSKFQYFQSNTEVLSVMGHAIAAKIAKQGTLESFKSEFAKVYTWAVSAHMLKEGDDTLRRSGEMSEAEYTRKSLNKTRNVYNNSVTLFGFLKFKALAKQALGLLFDDELNDMFVRAEGMIFTSLDVVSRSTVPEYVKTLRQMSDMTRLQKDSYYALVDGREFNLSELGGKPVLVLAARAAYNQYKAYSRNLGQFPLYPNEAAFLEGMYDCPQFIGKGSQTKQLQVDTIIFDLDDLIRSGVPNWLGKVVDLAL